MTLSFLSSAGLKSGLVASIRFAFLHSTKINSSSVSAIKSTSFNGIPALWKMELSLSVAHSASEKSIYKEGGVVSLLSSLKTFSMSVSNLDLIDTFQQVIECGGNVVMLQILEIRLRLTLYTL